MTKTSLRQLLIRDGVEFILNENIPEDLSGFPTRDLFIFPRFRMIFDPFQRLSYNEITEFSLAFYTVEQPSNITEFKALLQRYGISNKSL